MINPIVRKQQKHGKNGYVGFGFGLFSLCLSSFTHIKLLYAFFITELGAEFDRNIFKVPAEMATGTFRSSQRSVRMFFFPFPNASRPFSILFLIET